MDFDEPGFHLVGKVEQLAFVEVVMMEELRECGV